MKTFNFEFTEQQIKVIGDALMQTPYGLAAPIINVINVQIQNQLEKDSNLSVETK